MKIVKDTFPAPLRPSSLYASVVTDRPRMLKITTVVALCCIIIVLHNIKCQRCYAAITCEIGRVVTLVNFFEGQL